jgi:hypothetical protein
LQNFEFLSLKLCQSERNQAGRDVARAPARQSACARRTPPRRLGRSRLPEAEPSRGGGHSEALRPAPTPRGARPIAGRQHHARPCGPSRCSSVQARRPTLLAVPRVMPGVLHPAGMLSPSSLTRPGRALGSAAPCPPSSTRAAAGTIGGYCGELRFWPAAGPNEPSPTFPCTCPSLPMCPSSPQNCHLAGTAVATATAAGRRRPHLAGPPLPNRAQESTPKDPRCRGQP